MKPTAHAVLPLAAMLALPPQLVAGQAPPSSSQTAQEPQKPAGQEIPTFTVGTAAVTLDVVVRDKKDRAVRDLKQGDFEVYEDGVRQQIESFEVFGRPLDAATEAAAPAARPAGAPAATPAAEAKAPIEARPQVIAFVFDRLAPEARKVAHEAALTYVDRGRLDGDLVGVFSIDLALRTLQPFTTDAEQIRAGLDRAARQGNTQFGVDRAATRELIDAAMQGESAAESAAGANPGQGGSASAIGGAAATGALTNAVSTLQAGMQRNFEALERDQQGFASTNGLLAVVSGLKSLPGRKTVVFFSEGLAIPSNVVAQFRSVIHSANRANVSVYAMDAAGLRTQSVNKETRDEMIQAQARRQQQLESGRDDASGGAMTKSLERNEDLLRLNPESGLGTLANETGGFLIHDTNDAASAFKRIEEDMRFHYLVGYTPSNERYDGKFRAIQVKVLRSGVHVQSRQGYYAIRGIEHAPLRSFEAPALAVLEQKSPPHAFPLQVTALSFPSSERPGLAPVLVRSPGSAVTYKEDPTDKSGQKLQRGDFSVVVRIRNTAGAEVDRVSQHYPLSVPFASLKSARSGDILFYREADLPPGRYTLEAVGYDAASAQASVATSVLEVPKSETGKPRISSVVLVGRVEKVPATDQPPTQPLRYGETLLYPRMGEPVRKATNPALGFFFTVYGLTPGAASKALLEVYRGETAAGRVTADLPAADAEGRVQYAGSLPVASFPAGAYRLKVTTSTSAGSAASEAAFSVEE